jgi:hypothetical protein
MLSPLEYERVCRILVRLAMQIQDIEEREAYGTTVTPLSAKTEAGGTLGMETDGTPAVGKRRSVRTSVYANASASRSELNGNAN